MKRAQQQLMIIIPLTLAIIILILYVATNLAVQTSIVLLAIPLSLVGAFSWLENWSIRELIGTLWARASLRNHFRNGALSWHQNRRMVAY